MRVIKKIFKVLGILLLVLIGIIAVGLICTTILHRVRLKTNRDFLAEEGYYHPVSVGDHSLNLVRFGGNQDGHRIIALGGSGGGFPVGIDTFVSELKKENQVYYLARPGYDGSDDVKDDMTVDFVVEEYRKALQNGGVEAPYVLMPHSYASLYASYWVSKYPDEIEAMINLDGSIPLKVPEEERQGAEEELGEMGMMKTMINLGIMDVALHVIMPPDESYSEEEQRIDDAMMLMTMGSNAFVSEMGHAMDTVETVYDMMQPNDVPKLYINAKSEMLYESIEDLKKDGLSEYRINELTEGFTGSEEERLEKAYELEWEETLKYREETWNPYFEKLGNCKLVHLPGDHFLHMEQPHECAEIILDFLKDVK